MPNWTSAQTQAINSKGSVLVSASAGTGKTAVLTEKIVNSIVTENVNIDEMIVMTFSSAAANQMKERIKNRIKELANDENMNRTTKNILWKQLRKFGNAHIQTIHAFCNELIKKYFYVVGLDPNIRVADTFDVAIFKNKAIKEVMEIEYQKLDDSFISLEEMIDDTETIETVFINAYNKIASFIDYRVWLKNAIEQYNIGDEIPDFLIDMVVSDFDKAIDNYKKAIERIEQENNTKLDKILGTFKYDLSVLESVREGVKDRKPAYLDKMSAYMEDFGATVRFPNGDDFEDIKALRNDAKDLINSKYKKVNFNFYAQMGRIRAMYPVLTKFYDIFVRFDDLYISIKKENRIIDFNDMEKYAYMILQDDSISEECKTTFKKVFIDEYQDTNPIQEAIIDRISTENNLFCVGDLKQSIYRFRSSDPTLFLQRSKKYAMNMSLGNIISLNNNFRSSQNILDCSNDVFNYITSSSKEIDYTENDMLVHGRTDDNAVTPVEVQLLYDSMKDDLSMEELEIYNMVRIIKENIGQPIYDSEINDYRPTEYKDIVVLCRKLTGLTDYMAQIFTANNIPFVIERAGELFETTEIQIIMNIIDLINNPKNDLKILSLMHLGLFGFTDDDIIEVKTKLKDNYYDYMVALDDSSEISVKCKKMFSFFDDCREKQKYLSLTAILDYILSELKIYDIFAVMRDGKQRIANIKEFLNHAHDFENKYGEKLYGFANYIQNIKDAGVNVGEAILNYEENSVHITTIHKSKGLEYPVVILGFAGKAFNKMDRRANIVIDKDCGIGVKYYSHEKKEKGKCMIRTYIENEIDDKNVEEEMRLLYVAMTRAKEKLYIQGTAKEKATYPSLDNADSFLDWVMATVANSTEFCSFYGNRGIIKLVGNWDVLEIGMELLTPYIASEAVECDMQDIKRRFNIATEIKDNSEVLNEEYVPLVMSASGGLKKQVVSNNSLIMPDFLKPEKDPLYLGTVVHEFLRNVDFKNCTDKNGIENEKKKLLDNNTMNSEDLESVDVNVIDKFFQSELGQFIISSDSYTKEKYINIIKDAKEIGYAEENDILIRCILDLICEKDGKYYLIDYKTDKISNPDDEYAVKEKALTHKSQLDLYREALKNVYGITVEKAYIAFVNYAVSCEI